MTPARMNAILDVLERGHHEKIAQSVMRVFGASSLEECRTIYDSIGAAERASLDSVVERVTTDVSAAFDLAVDNKMS